MKKTAMALFLVIFTVVTSGCSHRGWVNFEEQTRIPGMFGGPMAAVNLIAKVVRLVVRDDGMAVSHDIPGESPPEDVEKN